MCCLRYELEYYTEVLQKFPEIGKEVKTAKGSGVLTKVDVLKEEAIIEYANEEETIGLETLRHLFESERDKKRRGEKSKKKKRREDSQVEEAQANSGD